MRFCIELGFVFSICQQMRDSSVVIPRIPGHSFLRRIVRKLDDLAVGCSEKYVIALADLLVDILCQLFSPFSRVVSKEYLTVGLFTFT